MPAAPILRTRLLTLFTIVTLALALLLPSADALTYNYRQATRRDIIARARIPDQVRSAAKRAVSPTPFPPSDAASGYTSTGTSPIAVYRNLDINGAQFTQYNGVTSREACQARCDVASNCYATTWSSTYNICYLIANILKYKGENVFLVSVSGVTCEQNRANIPAALAQRATDCVTVYRAGPDLGTSPAPGVPSAPNS